GGGRAAQAGGAGGALIVRICPGHYAGGPLLTKGTSAVDVHRAGEGPLVLGFGSGGRGREPRDLVRCVNRAVAVAGEAGERRAVLGLTAGERRRQGGSGTCCSYGCDLESVCEFHRLLLVGAGRSPADAGRI